MSKFRIKPGETVTVNIEGEKPDVSPKGKKPGEAGYVGVELTEEQLYVFRKAGVTFFDLGMVKSGETFVEIYDSTIAYLESGTGEFDLDNLESYGDLLLGKYLDHLFGEEANARKPIAFDSASLGIDVVQTDADGNEHLTVLGQDEVRPSVTDIIEGETELASNEGWKAGKLKIRPDITASPTFDAGLLPSDIAIELGERKLRRMNNPPRQLSLSPAYVDIAIKRGTLLAIEARGETIGNYIVEGYSINFQPNAATMNVTLREVGD